MEPNDENLVDELDKLQSVKKDLEMKEEELKRKLIVLAQQKNTNFLFGTHKNCTIKEYRKVVYPEDKDSFAKLLKEKGVYEIYSQVNYSRLNQAIIKKDMGIDKEIFDKVGITKDFRVSLIDRGV